MNKKLKMIVGSAVIGAMCLAAGSVVFADSAAVSTSDDQEPAVSQPIGRMGLQMGGGRLGFLNKDGIAAGKETMQTLTQSLVEEGIITQDIADKMISYTEEKDSERKAEMEKVKDMTEDERKAYLESMKDSKSEGRSGYMSDMVEAGILTQEQADSIKAYVEEQAQAKRDEARKEQLDNLVNEGLITQDQEDEMIAYYEEQEQTRQAEMEKVKAMTEDERKAYLESMKDSKSDEKPDAMAGLVEAGILTQDEADAISEYYQEQMKAKMEEAQAKRQEEIQTQLDSLVSAGTITDEQEAKIITYLNEQEETRKAEMEKVKSMTEDERKAYLESKKDSTQAEKGTIANPLQALVDDGTLTQDQADAVAKALFSNKAGRMGTPENDASNQ